MSSLLRRRVYLTDNQNDMRRYTLFISNSGDSKSYCSVLDSVTEEIQEYEVPGYQFVDDNVINVQLIDNTIYFHRKLGTYQNCNKSCPNKDSKWSNITDTLGVSIDLSSKTCSLISSYIFPDSSNGNVYAISWDYSYNNRIGRVYIIKLKKDGDTVVSYNTLNIDNLVGNDAWFGPANLNLDEVSNSLTNIRLISNGYAYSYIGPVNYYVNNYQTKYFYIKWDFNSSSPNYTVLKEYSYSTYGNEIGRYLKNPDNIINI